MEMTITMSFCDHGSAPTVVVTGHLDIAAATVFRQMMSGMHSVCGEGLTLDLSSVNVHDSAGRLALTSLACQFEEFGGQLRLPEDMQPEAII